MINEILTRCNEPLNRSWNFKYSIHVKYCQITVVTCFSGSDLGRQDYQLRFSLVLKSHLVHDSFAKFYFKKSLTRERAHYHLHTICTHFLGTKSFFFLNISFKVKSEYRWPNSIKLKFKLYTMYFGHTKFTQLLNDTTTENKGLNSEEALK